MFGEGEVVLPFAGVEVADRRPVFGGLLEKRQQGHRDPAVFAAVGRVLGERPGVRCSDLERV